MPDRDILVRIILQAATEGARQAIQELQQLEQAERGAAEEGRRAAAPQQALVQIKSRLATAARDAANSIRQYFIRGLQDAARFALNLLNPLNYLRVAFDQLWRILTIGFGYAAGRMLVRFFTDPLGAIQDLSDSVFDLAGQFQVLVKQFTVMLPEGMGVASDALRMLQNLILRTPLVLEDLTEAMRMLVAYGMDYRSWLEVVADTAAGTGREATAVAHALGMVAMGLGRGSYYLRMFGINVDEAGVKFDKAGRMIGETGESMALLFEYLQERFGGMGRAMSETLPYAIQNVSEFFGLIKAETVTPVMNRITDALVGFLELLERNRANLLAFAAVVGEKLAGAFETLGSWVSETARGMKLDLYDMAEWGINLVAMIADGIFTGIEHYLIPALVALTEIVAAFLAPGSPPQRGLLRRIREWGAGLMNEFLLGFAEADFRILDRATNILRSILRGMAAAGDIEEKEIVPILLGARADIAQLIARYRETGTFDEEILARVVDYYGDWADEMETLLRIYVQLNAAQEELARLQEQREDAEAGMATTMQRMRREGYTEEEVQVWADWYRRTVLAGLDEQIEEQRDVVSELEDQYSWQEALVDAQMDQVGLVEQQLSLLERLARAAERAGRAARELRDTLQRTEMPKLPIPDIADLTEQIEALKGKWRAILDDLLKPFARLEEHWRKLGDIVRGFLGYREPGWEHFQFPGMPGAPSAEYGIGAALRQAFSEIADNILPKMQQAISFIEGSVRLTREEWDKIAAKFGPGTILGKLLDLLLGIVEAGWDILKLAIVIEDPEKEGGFIDLLSAALLLAGFGVAGFPGVAATLAAILVFKRVAFGKEGGKWSEEGKNLLTVAFAGSALAFLGFTPAGLITVGAILVIRGIQWGIAKKETGGGGGVEEPEETSFFVGISEAVSEFVAGAIEAVKGWAKIGDTPIGDWVRQNITDPIEDAWNNLWAALTGGSIIPEMRADIEEEFTEMKAALVGAAGTVTKIASEILFEFENLHTNSVGELGWITVLKRDIVQRFQELKDSLVENDGIIPKMRADITREGWALYTTSVGEGGWLRKFVEEANKLLGELYEELGDVIDRIDELGNKKLPPPGGGGGGGGGCTTNADCPAGQICVGGKCVPAWQYGGIAGQTMMGLVHRGEIIYNPQFPRVDLAALVLRSLGPSLSFALGGGGGVVNRYAFYAPITIQVAGQPQARSLLRQLQELEAGS